MDVSISAGSYGNLLEVKTKNNNLPPPDQTEDSFWIIHLIVKISVLPLDNIQNFFEI